MISIILHIIYMAKSQVTYAGIAVFVAGLIALLLGAVTEVYSLTVGVIAALIIWIVGIPAVSMILGGGAKSSAEKPLTPPVQAPEAPKASEAPPQQAPAPSEDHAERVEDTGQHQEQGEEPKAE
jgi:hypothetical protein